MLGRLSGSDPLRRVWTGSGRQHPTNITARCRASRACSTAACPRYWRHAVGPACDAKQIGWRHEVLEPGKNAAAGPAERDQIYDTTLPGYGNGGHNYGDDLSAQQRRQVLEYLNPL